MKTTRLKFLAVFFLHVLLFSGFLFFAKFVTFVTFSPKDYVFAFLFSTCYFILIWNDLYSKSYHHYLRNAFYFTLRDLLISSLFLLALEVLWGALREPVQIVHFFKKDLLLIFWYTVLHALQFLWIVHLADLGFFRKNTIVLGSYDQRLPVEDLFQNINNTKHYVGQLIRRDGWWLFRESPEEEFAPLTQSFPVFLFSKKVNELIICLDKNFDADGLKDCVDFCVGHSIGYYLIPDIEQLPLILHWAQRFPTLPILERYSPNRDLLVMISLKRVVDILVSSLGIVLLSPILLLVSLLIWLDDRGPVFYISERVGIHGRPIKFVKFRSMVTNAEALKEGLLDQNERPDGPLFKISNDPRVTRVGKFLRKTSLDEIPQLWNVLKGDMSLIGPRPHLPEEVAAYAPEDLLRLECIPGIACLPQLYGRDTIGFRDWVDLDLEYRKNWSLFYDFSLFFRILHLLVKPKKKKKG